MESASHRHNHRVGPPLAHQLSSQLQNFTTPAMDMDALLARDKNLHQILRGRGQRGPRNSVHAPLPVSLRFLALPSPCSVPCLSESSRAQPRPAFSSVLLDLLKHSDCSRQRTIAAEFCSPDKEKIERERERERERGRGAMDD